ncbi:MAG: DNA cytosine methyltransferase, partial [Gemmatimonadaceae bacterium]
LDLCAGEVTLLAGGPPCQPFSKASLWATGDTARMLDPRAATLRAYFRVLDAALPAVMLLENVQGITYVAPEKRRSEEPVDVLRAELAAINRRHGTCYEPQVLAIDASDYGVPQRRRRVFIFAARDGTELALPEPTHSDQDETRHRLTTSWDAIGDLDDQDLDPSLAARGRWAALLPSIPEGENYQWHTPRGGGEPLFGWRTKYWSFLLKLAKSKPSWTLQALAGPATGPFHWRSRRLSVREMARLQTIPDSHEIKGAQQAARRQLGNAVPAAIGELLGLEIRRQLLGSRVRRSLRLIPTPRGDCPGPQPVEPVPAHYLVLKRDHEPHPGIGLGPGATQRNVDTQAA